MIDWRCIDPAGATLGEGPVWDDRSETLWWVDIKRSRLHRWRAGAVLPPIEPGRRLTALGLAAGGGLVALGDDGLVMLSDDGWLGGTIADPERGHAHNRYNDAKVGPDGALWAGSMDDGERHASGALYRITAGGGWTIIATGYRVTNGPAFSLDGRFMYHADSADRLIWRYALDGRGGVAERVEWARFRNEHGYPDGMTVDAHDHLWVAFWDGWCLRRLAPDGSVVAEHSMPIERPTCPTFGGADRATLFVTSATVGLNAEALGRQPLAGGLFAAEVGVAGPPVARFGQA